MTAKKTDQVSVFRNMYDPSVLIPTKIKAALESLLKEKGPAGWEREQAFLRRCGRGVGSTHLARYRPQFIGHIVEVKEKSKNTSRVWFASVKIAGQEREHLRKVMQSHAAETSEP